MVYIALVMSRTQVAPLRPMTIPRLELQAAVMGTRLAKTIREEHSYKIGRVFFWSDSKTVLCWIRSEAGKFKTFVANRIGEILENSNVDDWHWLPSKCNVADLATRNQEEFNDKRTWFDGPEFLRLAEEYWPKEDEHLQHVEKVREHMEFRKEYQLMVIKSEDMSYLPEVSRFSKWTKLIRSTAYVLRFVKILKTKRLCPGLKGEFSVQNLKEAEDVWNKKCQEETFSDEIEDLKRNKSLSSTSRLYQLSPELTNGVIHLKGRLQKSSELTEETKNPIILDSKHPYTRLLIKHYHLKFQHAGREQVLNELRQRFWILRGRAAVDKISKTCNYCRIRRARPSIVEMGQLPECRLSRPSRAFIFTGVDFFGPLEVTIGRRREKRYGVLFTCLSVRAIHLELAENLSTDSTILAIRFVARRGQPQQIFSDNGTNFKGSERELRQAISSLDQNLIQQELVMKEIEWKFIPPASPHMGGAWERMVGAVKRTLKVVLKERAPKEEVLRTLLAEVEHIVNSRPLTYVSIDPGDPESLTPNHFLIGTPCDVKAPTVFSADDLAVRKIWRQSQALSDLFWQRWTKEYLPTLVKRAKWFRDKGSLNEQDLVIIMDGQLPRNCWLKGRVIATYPGQDGRTRVADILTQKGTYRRPITKLCKLDLLECS